MLRTSIQRKFCFPNSKVSSCMKSGSKKNGATIFTGSKIFKAWSCLRFNLRYSTSRKMVCFFHVDSVRMIKSARTGNFPVLAGPQMDPAKSLKKVLKLEFLGKWMGLGGVHLADRRTAETGKLPARTPAMLRSFRVLIPMHQIRSFHPRNFCHPLSFADWLCAPQ